MKNYTDNGKFFLHHAQTVRGEKLLSIGPIDDDMTNPIVRLRSKISYSDRMRRFGVNGLMRCDWSGAYSPQHVAIPTEKYIQDMVIGYGDAPEIRTITLEPYRGMTIPRAVNRAGNDLRALINEGEFERCV